MLNLQFFFYFFFFFTRKPAHSVIVKGWAVDVSADRIVRNRVKFGASRFGPSGGRHASRGAGGRRSISGRLLNSA